LKLNQKILLLELYEETVTFAGIIFIKIILGELFRVENIKNLIDTSQDITSEIINKVYK
jgi:hypothetical protein